MRTGLMLLAVVLLALDSRARQKISPISLTSAIPLRNVQGGAEAPRPGG